MADLSTNQRTIAELLLARGRMHAYEIKQVLAGSLGHGSVYQALGAMQRKQLVEAEWELPGTGSSGGGPPRKYFTLTPLGRELVHLATLKDHAEARAARRPASPPPAERVMK